MVAEALLGLGFGAGGGGFGGGLLGLELVGEDLGEEVDDVVVGGEAVGDDELVDVLGVGGGVGDDEEAAVGVAAEVNFIEVKMGADGVQIGDLGGGGLRSVGVEEGRGAGAALVVEDDLAVLGDALPEVVLDHVDVGEAGASVDGEDGGG